MLVLSPRRHFRLHDHAFLQIVAVPMRDHGQIDAGVDEVAQRSTGLDDLAGGLVTQSGAAGDQVDETCVRRLSAHATRSTPPITGTP